VENRMGSEYRVWVDVQVATRAEAWAVEEALEEFWPFDLHSKESFPQHGKVPVLEVRGHGDGSIGAGWSPEQLAVDLKRLVWKTLQRYIEVTVQTRCIEPDETVCSDALEFVLARDGGLLCWACDTCGNYLPFGSKKGECAECQQEDAEELRDGQQGSKVGEEVQDG
jgi:hypothetical protein